MPTTMSERDQERADIAWHQVIVAMTDTALRTVDNTPDDEVLLGFAESLAVHTERGGDAEAYGSRLALIKLLYMTVDALRGTGTGERDLAAVAQDTRPGVGVILETALGITPALGMRELIRLLSYPDGDAPPKIGAIATAAVLALRVRLAPFPGDVARWQAVGEITAKVGR